MCTPNPLLLLVHLLHILNLMHTIFAQSMATQIGAVDTTGVAESVLREKTLYVSYHTGAYAAPLTTPLQTIYMSGNSTITLPTVVFADCGKSLTFYLWGGNAGGAVLPTFIQGSGVNLYWAGGSPPPVVPVSKVLVVSLLAVNVGDGAAPSWFGNWGWGN